MELEAAKVIGAGLAVIGVIGSGIGIGNIFSSFIGAVGRNPSARDEVFTMTMLGFALVEAIALFALVIALVALLAAAAVALMWVRPDMHKLFGRIEWTVLIFFMALFVLLLLVTGFGIKLALPGLHLWLPQAYAVTPAPAVAVLSGAMLKAGDFVYHPPGHVHDFMDYSDDIEIFELASPADHSAIDV